MSMKMTCYKRSMLEEDANSMGSIHLSEGVSATTTHIRYHGGPHEICYIENLGAKPCAAWRIENRKKTLKILLYSGIFALLMFGVFAVISLHLFSSHSSDFVDVRSRKLPYCLTEKCIRTSAYLLSSMNHKVHPCDNFYDFACGRWTLANPVPDGKAMWGMFNQLEQASQLIIKNILERESDQDEECVAEKMAKQYYISCLDPNEQTEKLGAKPLLDLLRDIGGWSIIDRNFNISQWNFQSALEKVQNSYNFGAGLFSWNVGQNDKNSSQYIIQIDQIQLTLPATESYKNITNNTKLYNAYLDYMIKVGELLGGDKKALKKQMQDIIAFEAELAAIMEPDEVRRDEDKSYHQSTIADLQKNTPFIQWRDFFADAFRVTNKSINSDQPVVIYATEFLKQLDILLKDYIGPNASGKKKKTLHNYLGWQAVRTMSQYLTKQYRESMRGLRKVLYGTEGIVENWRFCVTDTNNVLGFAIGALYVREAFHGDSKPKAKQMINNIKIAFKENFEKLKWMDKQTLELAKEKVDAMTDMIGFPDYILNAEKLNESYIGLEIKEDEYFMNNIRISQFRFKENLSKLDRPVNRSKWLMTPTTVNAYYSPNTNSIVFPAGILQAPFYDQDQHLALNYGAIGVVMGHEMTHAFDDQGREYDMHGNLNQWWKNETIDRFKEATECVVNQYSSFRVYDKAINGLRTLGENIADNGGLKAAYHAYVKLNKQNPGSYALPGLNYTENQLFFISFAQVWCSASTNETTNLQIERDTHVPSVFRVNGPIQNLKEFSEVFNCPKNSKMNPEMKCEIW